MEHNTKEELLNPHADTIFSELFFRLFQHSLNHTSQSQMQRVQDDIQLIERQFAFAIEGITQITQDLMTYYFSRNTCVDDSNRQSMLLLTDLVQALHRLQYSFNLVYGNAMCANS